MDTKKALLFARIADGLGLGILISVVAVLVFGNYVLPLFVFGIVPPTLALLAFIQSCGIGLLLFANRIRTKILHDEFLGHQHSQFLGHWQQRQQQ